MRQMHRQHQDVRDALVAFALEMVLGQPEHVVAAAVHELGDRGGLVEDGHELLVGQPAVVDRCGAQAVVVEINVASIQAAKSRDHV